MIVEYRWGKPGSLILILLMILAETLEVPGHILHGTQAPWALSLWIGVKTQEFDALFDGTFDLPPPVIVQGKHVSFIDSFVYLGNFIGSG